MRYGLLALVSACLLSIGGCACEHPTSFWWNTRLVPTTGADEVVSGTGLTSYTPAAATHQVQ